MFKIGNVKIKSPVIVAPMAGITNGAFRELCYEFNVGLTCCEMVSDKAIYYHNKKTEKMLEIDNNYHPISLQLFGHDVDTMVYAAKYIDEKTNADIIDINMGCPVTKVIKAKAGSYLMKEEDETVLMIKELVSHVRKPVSVKMRLGYDKNHMNYLSLAKKLSEVGIKAITLHARTKSQMYEGKADWAHIKILKDNLKIPIIGNGDVRSVDDFIRMKEMTNVDGVMIARGVVGNPFLLKEIDNYLKGKKNYEVSYQDKFSYCLKHSEKLIKLKGEEVAMKEMRSLAPKYINGLYYSHQYKLKMLDMNSYDDLNNILKEYENFLKQY